MIDQWGTYSLSTCSGDILIAAKVDTYHQYSVLRIWLFAVNWNILFDKFTKLQNKQNRTIHLKKRPFDADDLDEAQMTI